MGDDYRDGSVFLVEHFMIGRIVNRWSAGRFSGHPFGGSGQERSRGVVLDGVGLGRRRIEDGRTRFLSIR